VVLAVLQVVQAGHLRLDRRFQILVTLQLFKEYVELLELLHRLRGKPVDSASSFCLNLHIILSIDWVELDRLEGLRNLFLLLLCTVLLHLEFPIGITTVNSIHVEYIRHAVHQLLFLRDRWRESVAAAWLQHLSINHLRLQLLEELTQFLVELAHADYLFKHVGELLVDQ